MLLAFIYSWVMDNVSVWSWKIKKNFYLFPAKNPFFFFFEIWKFSFNVLRNTKILNAFLQNNCRKLLRDGICYSRNYFFFLSAITLTILGISGLRYNGFPNSRSRIRIFFFFFFLVGPEVRLLRSRNGWIKFRQVWYRVLLNFEWGSNEGLLFWNLAN